MPNELIFKEGQYEDICLVLLIEGQGKIKIYPK
jgi:hypothetical protein